MNWYKKTSKLSDTLFKMNEQNRSFFAPLLSSLGFDKDGKPLKMPKRTKEQQESHERWLEEDHEHMPA